MAVTHDDALPLLPLLRELASLPVSFSSLPQVCKKTEAAAKASELAKMRAFKAELDAQIDDNQASCWGGRQGRESEMDATHLQRCCDMQRLA